MQLRIKPYHKSLFPFYGVLIRGTSLNDWLIEIQSMELSIDSITVFPLPNLIPNSIWGCLVVYNEPKKLEKIGKNIYCQLIQNKLFVPENSILFPSLSATDIDKLFSKNRYIFHPEFGLFELEDSLNWSELFVIPNSAPKHIKAPLHGVFIPKNIFSFQIQSIPSDEILDNLEKSIFPKREKMEDKPLNIFEKTKLFLLQNLITKKTDRKKDRVNENNAISSKTRFHQAIGYIEELFTKNKWAKQLVTDLEELERRNQNQVDKLLDLFMKDPDLALKYAIPLDETSSSRGGNLNKIELSKKWYDFSLNGNTSNNSGAGTISNNHYNQLFSQYTNTANELLKTGEYSKAAFIYMKLLKNYNLAAHSLETGKMYQEAASIYLKFSNNKRKAAECFEKGKIITQAIEIYKELEENEKVGDLYQSINQKETAEIYYNKVIDNYKLTSQFVKASLIYKYKITDTTKAQNLLIEGWRENKDAYNCLNNYFSNITKINEIGNEIQTIYANETNSDNNETFLQVIKFEFSRDPNLEQLTKDIAYEIISEHIHKSPHIISELRSFNKKDKMLVSDIIKFKRK